MLPGDVGRNIVVAAGHIAAAAHHRRHPREFGIDRRRPGDERILVDPTHHPQPRIGGPHLRDIHPGAQIGSYPFFREGRVGANFVVRSTDPDLLASCVDTLCEALGEEGHDFTPGGI